MDRSHLGMDRSETYRQIDHDKLKANKEIDELICRILNLTDLHVGFQVIRNEKGWRENEKKIEYNWSITISKSFIGSVTLFFVKFTTNQFREIKNEEEIIQGIFSTWPDLGVENHYTEVKKDDVDLFKSISSFNLFESNNGVTLDGTSYGIKIRANGMETSIDLYNPRNDFWLTVVEKISELGRVLAANSKNKFFIEFYEN